MKKLLSLILALTMLLSLSTSALAVYTESDFSDIPTDWSHAAVVAAIENGLLQGYDGEINPDGFLKRAEMAAIIVRAFGGAVKADISAFKDVTSDKWYYNEMAVAVQMGIFEGDGTSLTPEVNITREQAALVLSRAFKLTDTDVDLSAFADADKVSEWALDGVAALVKAGYMQGDGTKLSPLDNISRKEFAQLMHNLANGYVTEAGVIETAVEGNIVIRVPNVTLKGVTINGDVVVGDGVGDGDFTLQDCTLNGRLIVRGGGANSIYLSNSAVSGSVIVARRDGAVHISVDDNAQVQTIEVDDGSDQVIVSGAFDELAISSDVAIVLKGATIEKISVTGDDASLIVDKDTTVSRVEVAASGVKVDVAGKVTSVNVGATAEGTAVSGTGKVENVTAAPGSAQTSVDTTGTTIVNNSSTPVAANGDTIDAGTTGKTAEETTTGGDGGGGSTPTTYYTLSLSIDDDVETPSDAVTATTEGLTLSGTTNFYAQIALLLTEEKCSELRVRFDDSDARDFAIRGLSAYTDNQAWTDFKDANFTKISGADKTLFENRNVTLAALEGETTLTYSYNGKTYTVTITITANT